PSGFGRFGRRDAEGPTIGVKEPRGFRGVTAKQSKQGPSRATKGRTHSRPYRLGDRPRSPISHLEPEERGRHEAHPQRNGERRGREARTGREDDEESRSGAQR